MHWQMFPASLNPVAILTIQLESELTLHLFCRLKLLHNYPKHFFRIGCRKAAEKHLYINIFRQRSFLGLIFRALILIK